MEVAIFLPPFTFIINWSIATPEFISSILNFSSVSITISTDAKVILIAFAAEIASELSLFTDFVVHL